MSLGDWIGLAALILPIGGGVLGVWLRVGMILEKIDNTVKRVDRHDEQIMTLQLRTAKYPR